MNKFASLLLIAAIAMFSMPSAQAETPVQNVPRKIKKKAVKKPDAPKVDAVIEEEEKEPDTTGSTTDDYNCELGNKLTVYWNADDDRHIAMRWKNKIHRLSRIDTTTGAGRFENRQAGLIWITIPAKGMLLDGKKGQQLANECKTAERPKTIDKDVTDTAKS